MLTRARSEKKENTSSDSASPTKAVLARRVQSEKRTSRVGVCIRRSCSDESNGPSKRQKSDDEASPPTNKATPLSPKNNMQTPPPKPVGVKRSLQFSSTDRERKPVSSRLQFPESPLKSPERLKKSATPKVVALAKNPALPVYQSISKNLNPSCTTEIVGRERELTDVRDFLNEKIDTRTGGSLYVSGGPGTGKTACLTLILKEIGLNDSIFVNCISKPTPLALLKEIASRLGVKTGLADINELLKGIERRTSGKKDNVVVVLDEIDALASKFQENLYSLFSMPAKKDSRLVLIGVANALDLTTRVLPHLKWLAPETRPVLIHFKPYSKFQLGQIISKRIGQDGGKVLPPLVVQYVAGKVANLNGDCRRALDVCRVCVDRKMAVKRKQLVLAKAEDKENGPSGVQEVYESVSLPEVAKVFSEGVGMGLITSASPQTNEGSLPLLQKLALLALWAAMSKAKKNPVVSLAKLYDVFRKICTRTGANSSVVSKSEFTSLCSLLESRGVIELRDGLGGPKTPAVFKSPRCTTIVLRSSIADLERDLRNDESGKMFYGLLDNPSLVC